MVQYYIVFPAGSTAGARSNTVETNPPVGGVNVAWTPVNGDFVASDYVLNSNLTTVTYSPPPPTTLPDTTPTMTIGAAAGTDGSVLIEGDNQAMRLQVTTGTSPTSGVLLTVMFYNPNNLTLTGYHPIFSPANAAAASVAQAEQIYLEISNTTNGFTLNVGTGKLAKDTAYIWNVHSIFT